MKGEKSCTTSCLHQRCVTRAHREYSNVPTVSASLVFVRVCSGSARIQRLSAAQPDSVGHASPPSSVFILPPTLKGLFSGAGGGKVSWPLCGAAFSARTSTAAPPTPSRDAWWVFFVDFVRLR